MIRTARTLVCALALAVPALHGCMASHSEPSLTVEAELASATLADDCAAERIGGIADCAPGYADCGFCQQTGVQVAIDASPDGDAPVPFEVVAVRLRAMDGTLLDELDPRGARLFVDGAYAPWDEQIAPGASLQVTYDTSSPDWATIGGGDPWSTYGMSFAIEMVVRIDGVERTLQLSPVSREPEIVT